ncbi:hypothetical protein DKX38_023423 [Salix brachista]|uniref:Uncharacterized protein n=1 Tax=Salix brachista TaxID=2182728 RepID=A0A5N5JII8_9ROSI|nr:hypothetical protein DKX38_023260 [Salix brachista]KAB5519104.1 hypothetical protein DKX38_023423 [Salix brachista]
MATSKPEPHPHEESRTTGAQLADPSLTKSRFVSGGSLWSLTQHIHKKSLEPLVCARITRCLLRSLPSKVFGDHKKNKDRKNVTISVL